MKNKIQFSDILVRLLLFFLWPFGIIPLALSKRTKHKVCLGFIYFALCCLIGLPALMYILLPFGAIADGYDFSYGISVANDMSNQWLSSLIASNRIWIPVFILVISLLLYAYQVVKDRKKAIEVKNIEVSSLSTAEIEKNETNQPQTLDVVPQKQYQKASLLTEREKNFYETIRLIADKHGYNVLSKVRLADIVSVSDDIEYKSSEWFSEFNKISRKHVDFALAEKNTLEIKLLIEIDDSTHQREDRIERDEFVDSVCEQVNIPILHLYDVIGLEDKIINILHSEKTEQEM